MCLTVDYYGLTVGGGGFQVSIQKRKNFLVAGLHSLQGYMGGPVLKSIEGYVGQRNMAQTKLQSRLDTPSTSYKIVKVQVKYLVTT